MTREEAIFYLRELPKVYATNDTQVKSAIDMAIEALQTELNKAVPPSLADVYKWERDIALAQLEEYGICFAEKKRDDLVEVVRCKDCLNYNGNGNKCNWGMKAYDDAYCSHGHYDDGSTPILNCADGERREP